MKFIRQVAYFLAVMAGMASCQGSCPGISDDPNFEAITTAWASIEKRIRSSGFVKQEGHLVRRVLRSEAASYPVGESVIRTTSKYEIDGLRILSETHTESSPSLPGRVKDYCIGVNPDYAFQLVKTPGTGKWTMSRYHVGKYPDGGLQSVGFVATVDPPRQRPPASFLSLSGHNGALDLDLASPRTWSQADGLSVEPLADGQYRVKFRLEYNSCPTEAEFVTGAAPDYLPVEYQLRMFSRETPPRFESRIQGTVTWEMDRGIPRGMRCKVRRQGFDNGRMYGDDEEELESRFDFSRIPPREFTLTAYGFPEPTELRRRGWLGIPLNAWLIAGGLAGAACLVVWRLRSGTGK